MKKNLINIFMGVLICVIIFIVGIIIVKIVNTDKTLVNDNTSEQRQNTAAMEKWQEGDVSYQGKTYRYNNSIKTYLFMGIDKTGTVDEAADGISGGQSDAMFLLVTNQNEGTLSIVSINRNAMTMIDVYDRDGNFVEQRKLPICLQHAYGDGMRISCLRTVDAVSRLFYNIPISGYLSLNMEAMPILNDAVGGVTVEVLEDIENASLGVSLKAGETVKLNGNEAYAYIRSRDINEFDSASKRLERQQQYIIQLFSQIKDTAMQSESALLRIYDSVEDYTVTNVDFVKLAEDSSKYQFDASRMYSIPGETLMGLYYEEYYVDEAGLFDLIINVFYEPVTE